MAITIKEIAEIAGVSRGTVDRVIHNRFGVNDEVKERVKMIIQKTGYKPNNFARALKGTQKQIKIGIIVPNNNNKFYIDVLEGIDEATIVYEPNGVSIIKMETERSSSDEQIVCINRFLEMGVNGIVLPAKENDQIRSIINEISDRVPVITYNTDVTNSKRLCFIGQNHLAAGRAVGGLMSGIIPPDGQVAMLISEHDCLAHMNRVQGVSSRLKSELPNVQILDPICTYESDSLAEELVTKLLEENKKLTGIVVAGGGQVGAATALARMKKPSPVKMICFDLLPQTKKYVQEGVVSFTIGQEPFAQGYVPIKTMYEKLVFGILPEREYLYTDIEIRSMDNIEYSSLNVRLRGSEI